MKLLFLPTLFCAVFANHVPYDVCDVPNENPDEIQVPLKCVILSCIFIRNWT